MENSPLFRSGLRRLLYPAVVHTVPTEEEKSEYTNEMLQRLALQSDDCQALPLGQRTFVGRYIDVASGEVIVQQVDIDLPGVIPFYWSRYWRSNHTTAGTLGNGWRHAYDFVLLEDRRTRQVIIRSPEHRGLIFPQLLEGEMFFNRTEKLRLFRDADGYCLQNNDGLQYRFAQHSSGSLCHLLSVRKREASYQIRFIYTSTGQLRRISDDAGRVIDLISDTQGRLIRLEMDSPNQSLKRQTLVSYRYDEAHDLIEATGVGQVIRYYHYRQHRLIRLSDASYQTTYFTYEKSGSYYACTELRRQAERATLRLRYLPKEGITQLTDAADNVQQYVHEGGLVHRFMSAGGRQRVWFYTEYGELLSEQDAAGNTSFFTYDEQGNVTQASWPDGGKLQMQYTEENQLAGLIDQAGGAWQWTYDERGQVVACLDPFGAETTFTYDETGLLVGMVKPDGQQVNRTYDAFANLQTQADNRGSLHTWAYDFLGQVTDKSKSGANLAKKDIKHAPTYQPTYDVDGQLVRLRRTNRLNWQYIREASGRVRAYTRADGCSTTFHYDAAGRLTEVLFSDGSWYHYTYRPDGWLVEATSPSHSVQFERDALGRIMAEKAGQNSTQTLYDNAGRLVSRQWLDGPTSQYTYDEQGNVSQLQYATYQSQFAYDQVGRLTEQVLPGGLRSRWQYDSGSLPTGHRLFWGGGLQTSRQQTYAWQQQQLMRLDDSRFGAVSFGYDQFGSVTEASSTEGWYDRWVADRSHYQSLLLQPASETMELGWQLLMVGVAQFYYDADGYLREKRVSGQVWSYHWHESGVLQQVTRPDNQLVTFSYDALGRRIEKKWGDYQSRWSWSARQLLHEWHQPPGSDPVQLAWIYTNTDQPTMLQINERHYSLISNYLGQPLSLHDDQGEPVWEWQWCLFGKKHKLAGPRHWFTRVGTTQFDDPETGLTYAGFHYYDTATGLPLSPKYSSPAGWARVEWEPPHAPESYLSAARCIRVY